MRRLLLPAVLLVRLLIASAFPASAEEAAGAPLLTLDQAELTLVKGKTQRLKTMLENV